MTLVKYGKPASDILDIKAEYFVNNKKHLHRQDAVARLYRTQPKRESCKACGKALRGKLFESHTLQYVICDACSHLNGVYEDTVAFCEAIYSTDGGKGYSEHYSAEDLAAYVTRKTKIYDPKAKFLTESLTTDPASLTVLDVGAGSGYFVAALSSHGFQKVQWIEPSQVQVAFGRRMLSGIGFDPGMLKQASFDAIRSAVKAENADLVSMIGVLEHVSSPRQLLADAARQGERSDGA